VGTGLAVLLVLAAIGIRIYRKKQKAKSNPHYVPTTPADSSGTGEEVMGQETVQVNSPAPTNSLGYTPVGQPGVSVREPRYDLPGDVVRRRRTVSGSDGITDGRLEDYFGPRGFAAKAAVYPEGPDDDSDGIGVPPWVNRTVGHNAVVPTTIDDSTAREFTGTTGPDTDSIEHRLGSIGSVTPDSTVTEAVPPSPTSDADNGSRNDGGYSNVTTPVSDWSPAPAASNNDNVGGGFGGGTTTTTTSDSSTTSGPADTTSSSPTD